MSKLIAVLIAALVLFHPSPGRTDTPTMPKDVELKIAGMVARDDGYPPEEYGTWFYELVYADEQEMYSGYMNIGMYVGGTMVRNLAIRIATADVVDLNTGTLFRQPDLMRFRRSWMQRQGTKPASLSQIGGDLECDHLKVVTKPIRDRHWTPPELPEKYR